MLFYTILSKLFYMVFWPSIFAVRFNVQSKLLVLLFALLQIVWVGLVCNLIYSLVIGVSS